MERLNNVRTYSEIYEIINILGNEFIEKIPKKLYLLIDNQRDKNYKADLLTKNGMLDETKISQETIALFAVLNMKYFIEDEEEKARLYNIYEKNEIKYEQELRKKYNPDDIFKNRNQLKIEDQKVENETALIEIKENFLTKFIKKLKSFFHIKKL